MRKLIPALALATVLSVPALAQARGFDSDLSTTITGPIKIEVVVSEDMAHRANNLPKRLSDRSSSSRLNSGFANNGFYGDKAIAELIEEMQDELTDDFDKYGIALSDDAATLLRVTIVEARPNRPTFEQLSREPSLSFQSFGIGGAELEAEVVSAGGEVLGTMSYDYYSSLNERPIGANAVGTWQDADRAMSRFSKKATKKLAALGATGTS